MSWNSSAAKVALPPGTSVQLDALLQWLVRFTHAVCTWEPKAPLAFIIEQVLSMPDTTTPGWQATDATLTSWHSVLPGELHWKGGQAVHAASSALDVLLRNVPATQVASSRW